MHFLSFIIWDVAPEIFTIGPVTPRWYGLSWALSFFLGYVLMARFYKWEDVKIEQLDKLSMNIIIGAVAGARLGHVLFYQPDYYLDNPIEILYVWEGGLASHGAAIGILLAVYYSVKKFHSHSFLWILDRLVITVALAGFFIRAGNLMNSEVYGKPTDVSYGFVYAKPSESRLEAAYPEYIEDVEVNAHPGSDTATEALSLAGLEYRIIFTTESRMEADQAGLFVNTQLRSLFNSYEEIWENVQLPESLNPQIAQSPDGTLHASFIANGIPRHPSQLYEGLSYLLIFLLLGGLYLKMMSRTPVGSLFGLFLSLLFSVRFVVEFFKAPQVGFEEQMALNMGQLLSIPFIIIGIFILIRSLRARKVENNVNPQQRQK